MSGLPEVEDELRADGFAFVHADTFRAWLPHSALGGWADFARSWDRLGLDLYMADGGRYRRRRHAVFTTTADHVSRKPAQPHYQSRDHNPLNGGIVRWFGPIETAVADGPTLPVILTRFSALATSLTPEDQRPAAWHAEVHQFRIEAVSDQPGRPTPEGMHRDGVDWVLVLMIARENIVEGTTTIHDGSGRPLGTFTLTEPGDAAVVDDHRVQHGVTAVEPLDPALPAHRDVLVVTLRR